MAQWFNTPFYKSAVWLRCRQSYIRAQHGICERCGNGGWHVHHKIYLTENNINDPQITLNHDNLELLCNSCHSREHKPRIKACRDDVVFDDNGDLVRR